MSLSIHHLLLVSSVPAASETALPYHMKEVAPGRVLGVVIETVVVTVDLCLAFILARTWFPELFHNPKLAIAVVLLFKLAIAAYCTGVR